MSAAGGMDPKALEAIARAAAQGKGAADPRMAQMEAQARQRVELIGKLAKELFILMDPGEHLSVKFVNDPKILSPHNPKGYPAGVLHISKPERGLGLVQGIDIKNEMGIDLSGGAPQEDPQGAQEGQDDESEDPEAGDEPEAGEEPQGPRLVVP